MTSLSIPVLGFGTDRMPGFYVRDIGLPVPWRVDSVSEVAEMMACRDELGLPQALVVARPVDPDDEMDRALHESILQQGLAAAERQEVTGKDVTPFLLGWFHDRSDGASLTANVGLVLATAELAAAVAAARG